MSVVRLCIRMAAVLAVKEKVWAGVQVYDTRNAPLQEAVRSTDMPWVSIFTDKDEAQISGLDVNGGTRRLALVAEIGIAGAVSADEATGPGVAIPASDAGYERAIDLMEMQVRSALFNDPAGPWGELFRKMVMAVKSTDAERSGEGERGARWAARFIVFVCDTISEPLPGIPMAADNPIREFLDAIKSTNIDGLSAVATLIEQEIIADTLPNWLQARALLGITEAGARGIGIAPPYPTPDTDVTTSRIGFDPSQDRIEADDVDKEVNPVALPGDHPVIIIRGDENPL